MPLARVDYRKIRKESLVLDEMSGLAEAVMPHLTERNLQALMVYEGPPGCWYADIVLKRVPPGVANSMGTPADRPHLTRQDAIREARHLLMLVMANEDAIKKEKITAQDVRVFLFHGFRIDVPPKLLDLVSEVMPIGHTDTSADQALQFFEYLIGNIFPEGFSLEAHKALSPKDSAAFQSAIALCMLHGIVRYPDPEPGRRH
jgi:hypothetical protein